MSSVIPAEEVIFLSKDEQLLLVNISQLKTHHYTVKEVINFFNKSKFNKFKINLENLTNAVEFCAIKDVTSMQIGERKNAELTLELDPKKLVVKAILVSAFGGDPITSERIYKDLKKLNVSVGIIEKAINLITEKSANAKPGSCYNIKVAKGLAAIDGSDTQFVNLIESSSVKLVDAVTGLDKSIELSNLKDFISVEKGTELMRIVPYKEGKEGLTVTGEILPCKKGKNIPVNLGKNTTISPDDPNLVIATVTGTPTERNNSFLVEEVLQLENLDNNSKPLRHEGNLIIKGDVNPGAKILVTGSVTIFGFIESAFVECSGDLFVLNGIIGDKIDENNTDFTCAVKCGGSLYTSFIQYATVFTAKDLNVQRQLLHSNISCAGYAKVQDNSGKRGVIFGGILNVKEGVSTVNLGAKSGIQTVVNLAGRYVPLITRKNSLQVYLDKIKNALLKTRETQNKLNQIKPPDEIDKLIEYRGYCTRLSNTISEYEIKRVETINEIQRFQDEIHNYLNTTRIHVANTVFNNVLVKIGDQVFNSQKNRIKSTTIRIKMGNVIAAKLESQEVENATQ